MLERRHARVLHRANRCDTTSMVVPVMDAEERERMVSLEGDFARVPPPQEIGDASIVVSLAENHWDVGHWKLRFKWRVDSLVDSPSRKRLSSKMEANGDGGHGRA